MGSRRPDGPEPPPRGPRAWLRRHPLVGYPYRLLIAVAGTAVVALGVVLLPLPGPGWLIIFAGVGIWASEFRWAAGLLRWLRRTLAAWARWAGRRSPLTRTLLTLLLAVVVLGAASASYVALRGTPGWVPDWVPLVN